MKFGLAKLTLLSVVVLGCFLFPKTLFAQGYFVCVWATDNTCSHAPAGYHDHCDTDYIAPLDAEAICNNWAFVPFANATPPVQERQCGDHFHGGACIPNPDLPGIGGAFKAPRPCTDPNRSISICTRLSYPRQYDQGNCVMQSAPCIDGVGTENNWFCCAHQAACVTGGSPGINSPLGCIPIDNPSAIATFFLRLGIAMSGGIAFLLIILASFQIMTSGGNPQRLQAGKELLTAAFTGAGLIIFSVVVLRTLGVVILQIPGL